MSLRPADIAFVGFVKVGAARTRVRTEDIESRDRQVKGPTRSREFSSPASHCQGCRSTDCSLWRPGNRSQVHWDMVSIQRPDYGGGEIYFDDKLIRKNGEFLPKQVRSLNRN